MLLRAWILFCAAIVSLGWILSVFGGVTPLTYEIALTLFVLLIARYHAGTPGSQFHSRRFIPARLTSFQLFLPGIFVVSVLLLFVKGVATPPCHDDGLCYRIPRAMNWIMDHRWHWISAQDARLDVLGTVSEWLSVPILLLFKTDRLVFLPNWICQLFLPGLIFSVWRNLGVSSKIAWLAMWLIPTGFCFALQAVNTSNDSLAAFFVLAAFFFALKGNRSKSWSDFAFSVLCISLTTGVKINQLSFVFAWIMAMSIGWRIFFSQPTRAAAILLWGALISFFPTSIFNWSHGRGWTGLDYVLPTPPGVNFICTTYRILADNLMPPLVPFSQWGFPMLVHIQHSLMGDLLNRYYHEVKPVFYIEIAIQQAGLGFIVFTLLALIFCLTQAPKTPLTTHATGATSKRQFLIFICLSTAFLHYLFLVDSDQPARLICSFYLLLTPFFFSGRTLRTWISWPALKLATGAAMLMGLYMMLFFAENPLFCTLHLLKARAETEAEIKQKIDEAIPPDEKSVGIIRFWFQREAWLWQPYGSRKVIELPLGIDSRQARSLGVSYVVISRRMLHDNHLTLASWIDGRPWTLVGSALADSENTGFYISDDAWYVVKIDAGP